MKMRHCWIWSAGLLSPNPTILGVDDNGRLARGVVNLSRADWLTEFSPVLLEKFSGKSAWDKCSSLYLCPAEWIYSRSRKIVEEETFTLPSHKNIAKTARQNAASLKEFMYWIWDRFFDFRHRKSHVNYFIIFIAYSRLLSTSGWKLLRYALFCVNFIHST